MIARVDDRAPPAIRTDLEVARRVARVERCSTSTMASGWTTIRASSSCSPRAVKKYAQRPKNRTKTRTKTHRRRKYATGQAEGEIRTRKAARTSDLPSALESLCRKGSRRSKGFVAAPQNDPEK